MYDYIIVGSGIAGLFTALLAAEHGRVLLLTKAALEESNTRYAQGGIAAAMTADDTPALHAQDTLIAGAGLCDPAAVRVLTEEAPQRIRDLLRIGVPFDQQDGVLALGLEGAHSARRILHAGGDATGWHIEAALCAALRQAQVTIREGAFVTEIIVDEGRATGVRVIEPTGSAVYAGHHIVLASGGAGQLFAYTTNPAVATGDGLALAYRAGAALADLEFYQFHPTALRLPDQPTFLVSEAVRGEGAYLRTAAGERFMPRYHAQAELAPRDVVARAIAREMQRTADAVYLDLRHLPATHVRQRFPTIAAFCTQAGLDLATDWLPVAPAAHYYMGGVQTDVWGATSVPGLFACGEVACTGVHGANRLASNSLLEGIVFGARIVQRTLQSSAAWQSDPKPFAPGLAPDLDLMLDPVPAAEFGEQPTRAALQGLMWQHVGLERSATGLHTAARTMAQWAALLPAAHTVAEHELENQVLVARLMTTAALARTESRGAHYRADAPATDPAWCRRTVVRRASTERTTPAPTLVGAIEL